MINRFIHLIYISLLLIIGIPTLFAAEQPFEVVNQEEKVFKHTSTYPFLEQRYDPPVNFQLLEKKHDKSQYINPYPEDLTALILMAMKSGDYNSWLGYWTPASREFIKKEDNSTSKSEKRKSGWKKIFNQDNDIKLMTLVHVGEAQYTYIMAICDVVRKTDQKQRMATIYIPMMTGIDGRWVAAQELLGHPVFKHYTDNQIIYYHKK